MKIYRLKTVQNLPISQKKAWDFLSDPKNLKRITPDYMSFNILEGAADKMYAGQIIQYIVTPLLNIPTKWVTEITHVDEGNYFVDEQRFGPYALWHHKHFIKPIKNGVEMIDIIDYKILSFYNRHVWYLYNIVFKICVCFVDVFINFQ